MLSRIPRAPMAVRLPLAVGAMILLASLAVIYIAMLGGARQMEHQLERMGQIYLDGLSAAVLPAALRQDADGIQSALDEALRIHHGLIDRRLLVLTPGGRTLARADRPGLDLGSLPQTLGDEPMGHEVDAASGSFWIWRPLQDPRLPQWDVPGALKVVAKLDISGYAAERTRWMWGVALVSVAASLACALLGLLLVRRLQRPLVMLTRHLQESGQAGPTPVDERRIPTDDPETQRLLRAYNRTVERAREREALLVGMAEREREAVLGRVAATLAHEIRNPLAGTLTAVDTLRKFGDQRATREEALDFMERGLRALEEVANATLRTYRQPQQAALFGLDDVHDVQRLVAPQAQRARVTLDVRADVPHPVRVAGGEVRQVLLNLLLNAIKASPPGASVTLTCALRADHLVLEVQDQGSGMSPDMAQRLEQGDPVDLGSAGLGVAVVVRLVQRLRGRVAVQAQSGHGTRIALELPLDPDVAAEDSQ